MKNPACTLTIAGTDPSGGAGIHADLKTFQELQTYGMSVITSVVAQNTTGVKDIHHVPLAMIDGQLQAVLSDMPVHAFKTGMIANIEMMKIIANHLPHLDAPFVMDPVMIATSGDVLIEEQARDFLREHLLPQTTLITPNMQEAAFLTETSVENTAQMKKAGQMLVDELGAGAALIKGGHLEGKAIDFLYDGISFHTFEAERVDTTNTHGTGCTYSAAITAYLSKGYSLERAVHKSKQFITAAIQHSFALGSGNGPTNHWASRVEEVRS